METKYYVGYKQDNNAYVYINYVDKNGVKVTTTIENAIYYDDIDTAKDLLSISKIVNTTKKGYKVLEITTTVKEID